MSDEDISVLFSEENKNKIIKSGKTDSVLTGFLNDFTKNGLKAFLKSASKELIYIVLKSLSFGGAAKIGFDFLKNIIGGM